MSPRTDRVAVAWVHPDLVSHSWAMSLLKLTMTRSCRLLPMQFSSAGIAYSRNRTVTAFLKGDDDWLFWLDTDIGFDPDALDRLLDVADAEKRPVVGGLYFANHQSTPDGTGGFVTVPVPTLYRWAELPDGRRGFVAWPDYPRDQLVQCDALGSGCVLIHRSVFEAMQDKYGPGIWYTNLANPGSDEPFGEDMSFCVRLAEFGIPAFMHTGVKTTHMKTIWLSESHYDALPSTLPTKQPTPNRAARRARKG